MNISRQFKLLIYVAFLSISSFAAVPSASEYSTQTPQFFMDDELQDNLSMPSFLLCFQKQLAAEKMVTGPAVVTYLALVDQPECDSASQVTEGAQTTTKAAAASAKAEGAGVDYTKVTTQVSQATSTSPMVIKAWVPLEDNATAYVLGKAIGEATADQPYGEFSFDYTIFIPEANLDVTKGSMSSSGAQLKWIENALVDHDNDSSTDMVTLNSAAVINFGSGSTGSGAVRYTQENAGGAKNEVEWVAGYAFNAENFCRQNLSMDGGAISDSEKCFFTDEAKGKKEVFSYSLYDPMTGARFQLGNSGFGLKFSTGGVTKYGYADFNGVHFDEETALALPNGQVFSVDEGALSGETVTLDILQTKLFKSSQTKVALDSLDSIPFTTFVKSNSSVTNMSSDGTYTLYWDKDNNQFVATQKDFEPLGTALTFSATEWLGASGADRFNGLCAWAQGVGEICIENTALTSPSALITTLRNSEEVAIADYPTTLHCLDRCPNYTRIEAEKTKILNDQPEGNLYTERYSGTTSDFVTYTLNTSTYNYGEGSGDSAIGSVSEELYGKLNRSRGLPYGLQTGPLVTDKSSLACAEESDGYCLRPVWDGTVSVFYAFESGHRPFQQKRRVLDSSNNAIAFTKPLTLYFTAPDDVKYGKYAGKEVKLEYAGGNNLWGIPGSCLNLTTSVFSDNCYKNGSDGSDGYWPWVDQFKIPKNETTGVLYTGRGKTGTSYLAAQNEGVVFLGLNAAATGTLTLGTEGDLPTAPSTNVGPNGGANYIGAEPTQPTTASIRAGEKIES